MSYQVEFKGEQRERLNDRDFVEVVVCLANGTGGVVLVGVEDDGTIGGARPRREAGAVFLDGRRVMMTDKANLPRSQATASGGRVVSLAMWPSGSTPETRHGRTINHLHGVCGQMPRSRA